jgi:copper chaperone CopZ
MKQAIFEVPALYGDHHVIEVRRILLEIPGVQDVYASSAFQQVEVTYDPDKVDEQTISAKLGEAGYSGELPFPTEVNVAANEDRSLTYFRHTAVYETNRQVVSFSQNVAYTGRPLWNCPGFGVIKNKMEE